MVDASREATETGREDPAPGRQLGRDVDDLLAGSKQPHGDVVADPLTASTAHTRSSTAPPRRLT
jgi:hypothetical protein